MKKPMTLLLILTVTSVISGCTVTVSDEAPIAKGSSETGAENEAENVSTPSDTEEVLTEDGNNVGGRAPDYSDENDWLHLPSSITHEADTFYVYPTVTMGEDIPADVPIDNEMMRTNTQMLYDQQATCYEDDTNVFAPYYRQKEMGALTAGDKRECEKILHDGVQYADIVSALDYYFENYNEGRPYILAAHSQGSIILKSVLKEYMLKHPDYYERMLIMPGVAIGHSNAEL